MSRVLRVAAAGGAAVLAIAISWMVAAPTPAVAQGAEGAKYVGSAACKKCHLKEFKSWAETPMAKAFSALKPGERKEAKEKAKLDPAKDYSKEKGCVKCHVTGYGQPGGHPKVADADQALAAERQGVQCESCHGPGSLYTPYMKEHEKDYKTEEAVKLGLVKPNGSECNACHKGGPDGSPTMKADEKFDGPAKMKEGAGLHGHFKKKK